MAKGLNNAIERGGTRPSVAQSGENLAARQIYAAPLPIMKPGVV
jgi:hypothetical protein